MSYWKNIIALLIVVSLCTNTWAQQNDSSNKPQAAKDTLTNFVKRFKKLGAEETVRSIERYKSGQLAIKQQNLIEEIKALTQKAKIIIRKGVDTISIERELKNVSDYLAIAGDAVFVNKETVQSQRNLAVSSAILTELYDWMKERNIQLNSYTNSLTDLRFKIDSLNADPDLYVFPDDSLSTLKYLKKVVVVSKEIGPTDTALTLSLAAVQELQNKVEMMVYTLHSSLEDIEKYRKELTAKTFDREMANFGETDGLTRPQEEINKFSYAKEILALRFYINDYSFRIVIQFVLIIVMTFFLRSLKSRLQQEGSLSHDFKGQLVLRHPFLSSIVITTSIFQFIFINPPFIFSFCIWLSAAVCLSFIFRKVITGFWMIFWIIMILLFIASGFNNMILQPSSQERSWMMVLSIIGVLYGGYLLLSPQRKQLREKSLIYFIAFVVLAESGAVLANYWGRYNLSKTLLISGYSGVIVAILFLWTVRMLNELLGITSSIYKHPEKKLFFINFEKIGDKVPALFYYFLIAGWLILIGRHSYAYKLVSSPFNEFLNSERTVGDYTFTINGLFIFILILICSMLLSRLISFFAAEPAESDHGSTKSRKVSLGSWLLLIRIFIISMGIFLAFAASGIPLDKITIILGALGVGIGLGLQGLVNNLVSGLIIAFEKPVNVGDTIEINDKPGTMKSIGFRSSVVMMADGAFLIIPNGDLLSQHLVNWTMGKNIKRLNIPVAVAYNTDLEKAQTLINELLQKDDRILKSPASQVVVNAFNTSSIDFDVFFWVHHGKDMPVIKSDIITQINTAFKAAGIVIPLPQQEISFSSLPPFPTGEKA